MEVNYAAAFCVHYTYSAEHCGITTAGNNGLMEIVYSFSIDVGSGGFGLVAIAGRKVVVMIRKSPSIVPGHSASNS
ncbi:hypothetical protein LSTR_LSTR016083 [Laodelphax striatellus]|uniref:Uncharacterized protein n=1 Tax=Laodelphax striatellus TaxID=195883 RepID=A0A482WM86_LAOST|nr:hypothetical protein LSTR_LSTR016083 [Laodelphax striatellus]